ncbi:2'-deoxycytidine 5'-triphosphate deaminase [Rhodobacteraceae bacterium NNCM2]|nr:2'-deoxycytidine 5'-triphosphate deaminase [Coraliihabitans acroporae]
MTALDHGAPADGVLASQDLRAMIASGQISASLPVLAEQIQPASLDLRLGTRAWRVRASFLAGSSRTVADRLDDFAMHEIDLANGAVLERGCVYVVELAESLALPGNVAASANAKSSTGRLDLFTRLIADRMTEFDRVEAGYTGPLYAEISPRTFSVLVRPGIRLNQIRFARGRSILTDAELRSLNAADPLVNGEALIDGGLGFSVDLIAAGDDGVVGWRARRNCPLIDLARINHYPVEEFWEPVRPRQAGGVILDPGAFYILVSREAVSVPPLTAAEMVPYMAVAGEFRVHYAGFFDPGFGHSSTGGSGSRGVLEVRCHEAPFALEHGQMVGRLVYERMCQEPDILYGRDIGSNYQGQALKLAKHFQDR